MIHISHIISSHSKFPLHYARLNSHQSTSHFPLLFLHQPHSKPCRHGTAVARYHSSPIKETAVSHLPEQSSSRDHVSLHESFSHASSPPSASPGSCSTLIRTLHLTLYIQMETAMTGQC